MHSTRSTFGIKTCALASLVCLLVACGDSNSPAEEEDASVVETDDGRRRDLSGFPDIGDDPLPEDEVPVDHNEADENISDLDIEPEIAPDQSEEPGPETDLAETDLTGDPDLPDFVVEVIETDTDDERDTDLDTSWDSETACGPPNSDDPLPAVLDLRSTPRFLEIQVSFAVLRSDHVKRYDIYMDGELAVEVGHEERVARLGGVVYDLASSVDHVFFVRAVSDSCREGAASEELTASSVQHFALALQAGTAPAGGTGSFDLLLTNSEPITAVSFKIEDTPDWLTFTGAAAEGWSWDVSDDGSNGHFTGTANEAIPVGEDHLIATIDVSAASGVSGMVRMTPGEISVTGASSVVNTSDGRFTVTE